VETEIVNHSLMRHPHIIQFRDVFVTSSFICIVLEYAGSGTLHSYVRRFGHLKESVARWFFQQLTLAVDYCHRKGVANRDIKLENTLMHVSRLVFVTSQLAEGWSVHLCMHQHPSQVLPASWPKPCLAWPNSSAVAKQTAVGSRKTGACIAPVILGALLV
jgi:serine/threonine protein kinase